jgi:hypothetical protein
MKLTLCLFIFCPFLLLAQRDYIDNVYLSNNQVVTKANFESANVTKSETIYILITTNSINPCVRLQDAPFYYPGSQNKTWTKEYRLYSHSDGDFWTKDASNQTVLFEVDENSADSKITMSIYSGNNVVKRIVYYIQ